MDNAFEVHKLNDAGIQKAKDIAESFDNLLTRLNNWYPRADPRLMAIVRTKLEEACFFAKKAMATDKANQVDG